MSEICMACGKPIEMGQPSYYKKNPKDDIGESYHSTCGDPLGIQAAVAAERERCAKIAEKIYGGRAHTYASENADVYRAQDDTCAKIAAAIRKSNN